MNVLTKHIKEIRIVAWVAVLYLASCAGDPSSPGKEFMPDMYRSPSYETNSANNINGDSIPGMTSRSPVEGTIPRGYYPYPYPNTNEGYEAAGAELISPFPATEKTILEGKVMYEKFCILCHGINGAGDGSMVASEKFPPPPSFNVVLKDLPEGKMFHSITYGRNLMGSHTPQLNREERWKTIHYVKTLQGNNVEVTSEGVNEGNTSTETEIEE